MKNKLWKVLGMVVVALTFVLVGCSTQGANDTSGSLEGIEGTAIAESGTLLLKVNPEIAIDYDADGKVTSIRGLNDDGEEIVRTYPDFIGKDSGRVLKELIAMIGDAGYFVEEVEGKAKQIILELEAGSALPNNEFLEHMAINAQSAVEEYKLNSDVTVDGETFISLEDAKQIAFKHAGVDGSQAKFDDQELETDDGVPSYELEFKVNQVEYEYDIHAVTGEVLKYEVDNDDNAKKAQPVKPANNSKNTNYDESAYGEQAKPAAPAPKPAAPAPKPVAPKPAPQNKGTDYSDYSDYSDYTDYDDSDYDDTDYSDYSDYSNYSDYD